MRNKLRTSQFTKSIALALIALAVLPLSLLAQSQDNYKSAGQPSVILRSTNQGSVHTPHVILDGDPTGTSTPTATKPSGSATIATSQAALTTTASQVAAASTIRRSVLIRNLDASISVYVGASGVISTTGMLVKAGESITINTKAAVFAVSASGTPTVATLSEND